MSYKGVEQKVFIALLSLIALFGLICQPIFAEEIRYPAYDQFVPYKAPTVPYLLGDDVEEVRALVDNPEIYKIVMNYTDVEAISKDSLILKQYKGAGGTLYIGATTALISLDVIAPFLDLEYTPNLEVKQFTLKGHSLRHEKEITITGKAGAAHVKRGEQSIAIDPVHPDLKIEIKNGKFYVPIIMIYQTFGYFSTYDGFSRIMISDMKIDSTHIVKHYSDYKNSAKAIWEGTPQLNPVTVSKHYKTELGYSKDTGSAVFNQPPMGMAGVCISNEGNSLATIITPSMTGLRYAIFPHIYI